MDKPNIVTCTAPVNIAVIKYCKYYRNVCFRTQRKLNPVKSSVRVCGDLCFSEYCVEHVHNVWLY